MEEIICKKVAHFRLPAFLQVYVFMYPKKNTILVQVQYKQKGLWKTKLMWNKY